MGDPYTSVTVANYNLNPPPDDGTVVPENKLNWSKHKEKLADPLKTAIEAVNTNISAALAKLPGGAGVATTAISYEVASGDQGKMIRATQSGVTITTPSASVVGSPFVFEVINNSTGDIAVDGNGAQTINGEDTITVPKTRGLVLWTDGSNWFARVTWHAELRALPFSTPRGRLTLTTAVPVLTADVTGAETVYYTPYHGNTVMLPDANGDWALYEFSELSQALSDNTKSPAAAGADSLYDMFVWSDSGTIRCTRGPAWSNATTRGTGAGTTQISLVDGVYCNTVAISNGPGAGRGVYVGTISTNGSTQLAMTFLPSAAAGGTANRLDVWNMYNGVDIFSFCRPSDNTWTYNSATIRAANGSASYRITFVCGLSQDALCSEYLVQVGGSTITATVGIGYDATDAYVDGSIIDGFVTNDQRPMRHAIYNTFPAIGRHFISACEAVAVGTATFYGDNNVPTHAQSGLILRWRM